MNVRKSRLRTLLLGAAWTIWAAGLAATQVPLQSYTVDDGLPQSTIYSALQDRTGYLWFGTQNGVCRFNGIDFTAFTREKDGATEARVLGLYEDEQGNIWASTNDEGLYRYDGRSWRQFTTKDGLPSDHDAGGYVSLGKGAFLVGFAHSAAVWDGESFKPYPRYDELVKLKGQGFGLDRTGRLWFFSPDKGVMRFDWNVFTPIIRTDLFPNAPVLHILSDSKGRVWVAQAGQGLRMWDGTAMHVFGAGQGPLSDTVLSLYEDHDGYVWVGTTEGVSGFSDRGWITLTERDGLPNNAVQVILQDREGNLWFGTLGGLARLGSLKFRSYTAREGLPNNSVWAIHQDTDHRILLGLNEGGIMAFDGRLWTPMPALPKMATTPVRAFLQDSVGRLWVGTGDGVAVRRDGRWSDAWAQSGFPPVAVVSIVEDRGGRVWFATAAGLACLDGTRWGRFTEKDGLPGPEIRCLYLDREGRVWAGTSSCAAVWNGRSWKTYTTADGLANNYVIGIAQDEKGVFWFATFGGGITRWDGTAWRSYSQRDGLSNNYCYFILPDRDFIYVGTNKGLNRFDGTCFKVYGARDGLASTEMNQGADFRDREGNLWFGTVGGVTRFDPSLDRPNPVPPPVILAGLKLFDRAVPLDRPLRFHHNQNFLKFDYYAIAFTSPEKVMYRYRLEGVDSDWVQTSARSIAYPYLPPGSYTFRVQASSESESWSPSPATLSFVITPPFWATLWFRMILILGALAVLVGIRRIETRAIRTRALLLERMVQERTRELEEKTRLLEATNVQLQELDKLKTNFLSTVSHELRTPLTSIRAFSEILLDHPEEGAHQRRRFLQIIHDESERLTRLIEDLLDLSRIQSGRQRWTMRPLKIADVVDTSVRANESLVKGKGLDLAIRIPPDLPGLTGDFDRLVQVFTNLISNAVKFTPQGGMLILAVELCSGEGEAMVHASLSDTGEGIPEDQLEKIFQRFYQVDSTVTRRTGGTGLGLAICREIMTYHGGRIWAESVLEEGSIFHIVLPIHPPPAPVSSTAGESPAAPPHPEVLIVDDEPNIRAFIRYELEKAGYPVAEAATGEEALELALRDLPGVILLDILLPGIDGFEVIRRLKADPHTRGIEIVVVSILDDREHGLRLGAYDYHTKPVDKERLFRTVTELLGRRNASDGQGVLVVDDDKHSRKAVCAMLHAEGYRTVEASDGPAALESARREAPALIIMDLHLPGMDGHQVIRALKADDRTSAIPVVVLTASDLGQSRIPSLLLGAADYYRKPFSREEFMEGLKRILARAEERPKTEGGSPHER